jgi:DNA invertase Pin-like site-specific DNA recombinase
MQEPHKWMKAQVAEHKVEPNSGMGKAISYLLKHWLKLTLFLLQPGVPVDNNAMAGLLAILAVFEREILRVRTRAGLTQARQNGKHLGRPETAAQHAAEIRKLHRADISKSEIARRLHIGRTSVRRILGANA